MDNNHQKISKIQKNRIGWKMADETTSGLDLRQYNWRIIQNYAPDGILKMRQFTC